MVIKPHIAIIVDVCFLVGHERSAIDMDSHAMIDGPDGEDQSLVAKQINSGLVVEQD